MSVRILLVDDHPFVRQGLRAVLETEPDLEVVGEAGDGLEALEKVEQLQPDVVVVDLMIPSMNGLEIVRQIDQQHAHTRTVVLTMHAEEAFVMEALRSGACGYVLKDSDESELVQAVRAAANGQRYLSGPLTARAIDAYVRQAKTAPADAYEALTARERQVLHLAANGHSNAEIAERLHISPRTASTHRTNLMRKLELHNQTELAQYALQRGIILAH